jgi:hypothetical protein
MHGKIIKVFAFFFVTFLLFHCKDDPNFPVNNDVQGYRPVYASASSAEISFLPARPLINPGTIVRNEKFLLIGEPKQGVHFFDNTDSTAPKALGFLQITGNTELAVRNDVLYADNESSLLAIDIKDINHITVLSHVSVWSLIVPPARGFYFECIDTTRGPVVGWNKATLHNPKCYRGLDED